MPGPYGPTTFDSPNPMDIEIPIVEIIDNSIDAGANKILVEVKPDLVVTDSFSINVYDNGTKVVEDNWTQENIDKAFEIEIDPNNPELIRSQDSIGKFHVGMKIAPLTKYYYISMFTKNRGRLLEKHGMYPSENKIREDPELLYGGQNNPFNRAPQHIDKNQMEEFLTEKKMNTCVMMSHPRVKILPTTDSDISCIVILFMFVLGIL